MKHINFFFGIFLVLAASRFIPHPPNFTSLIALSFYVPLIFGSRYIFIILIGFIITDLIIGLHSTILFTWGSIILIGVISKFFKDYISLRFFGILFSCMIFYLISNFGVWLQGTYGYHLDGLFICYVLAIPFFGNTLVATIIYSIVIECIFRFILNKKKYLNT